MDGDGNEKAPLRGPVSSDRKSSYFAGVVVAVVVSVVVDVLVVPVAVVSVPVVVVAVVAVAAVPVSSTTAGASVLVVVVSVVVSFFWQPVASAIAATAAKPRVTTFFISLISFLL
jgi:hypothetical protein